MGAASAVGEDTAPDSAPGKPVPEPAPSEQPRIEAAARNRDTASDRTLGTSARIVPAPGGPNRARIEVRRASLSRASASDELFATLTRGGWVAGSKAGHGENWRIDL